VSPKSMPWTVVALVANPALAFLGKYSLRLELAPLPAHALFIEGSRVDIDPPGDSSTNVKGWEIDVGYHLWVLERGLSGLYLGPRYLMAGGTNDLAKGKLRGWGGDIGWQWTVGPVAINAGFGAAWVEVEITPNVDLSDPRIRPEVLDQIPKKVDATGVIPLLTLGAGFAF
jgi:hypothetical protein